jgi:teichuronic acid biosynthesis glycosyltransferase TuaC
MARILLVTNLYPNSREPVRGLYIKQLVDSLRQHDEVRVVAPVPWLPRAIARKWRPAVDVPREEVIDGITVYHPRYLVIPKILRFSHALTFALCVQRAVGNLSGSYPFQLISVHWIYPDAVGTVLATRRLGVPVIAHALGCDINDYLRLPLRRGMIRWALSNAAAVITKSQEIADKVADLGISRKKITTIHNGVSRELFHRRDKFALRKSLELPLQGRLILFIGNLSIEKGIPYLLDALASLRDTHPDLLLLLIGDGPLRDDIQEQIRSLGIASQARLVGRVPHDRIALYLGAADALCLPSIREGCPNVVLESLASGTPVVASAVGAIPEMMRATNIGYPCRPADVPDLRRALVEALSMSSDVEPKFQWPTWQENADQIRAVFDRHIRETTAH